MSDPYAPLFAIADAREGLRLGRKCKFPFLAAAHLGNVNRDNDRTTIFIKERVIKPLRGQKLLARSLAVARLVNQIQVLPTILPLLLEPMSFTKLARYMELALVGKDGIMSPTYGVTRIPGVTGVDNIMTVAWTFEEDPSYIDCAYLETAYNNVSKRRLLGSSVHRFSPFAYCLALDLLNDTAEDRYIWGAPTDIAMTGLGYLVQLTGTFPSNRAGKAALFYKHLPLIMDAGGKERNWRVSEVERALWLFCKHTEMVQRGQVNPERGYYAKSAV